MPKPIFMVGIPNDDILEEFTSIEESLKGEFTDYHIIIYSHSGNDVKFECFYEKDFNNVKYEELKNIVLEQMAED